MFATEVSSLIKAPTRLCLSFGTVFGEALPCLRASTVRVSVCHCLIFWNFCVKWNLTV